MVFVLVHFIIIQFFLPLYPRDFATSQKTITIRFLRNSKSKIKIDSYPKHF